MTEEKPYWIIVNYKKNCIWKQPYYTYEGAKIEFDHQVKNLKNNEVSLNWVIEKRTSYITVDKEKILSIADEDFKNFK